MISVEAKESFLDEAMKHITRSAENFPALVELATRLCEAEQIGLIIEPESVRKAVRNVLGVD